MNTQRPPQRPPRPPITREEYIRRQTISRARARKQKQRRALLLMIAALFIIMTVLLISTALHRAGQPANPDDTAAIDPSTTAAPTIIPTPTTTAAPSSANKNITICIDPGHGYDDPGASTSHLGDLTESDVTLSIGLKLRDELLARGYTVIMTHETNDIPAGTPAGEQYLFGLAKRTAFANNAKPDFYLSIHGDTYEDPSVQGSRVYYRAVSGADNTTIATIAQGFVDALTLALPDAKKAPLLKEMWDGDAYYVLRNVTMQAVLVEVGFASNANDAANMLNPDWQATIALALADGVDRSFAQ